MLREANDHAKALVSTWIRSVFREACLLVLHQRCRVEEVTPGKHTRIFVDKTDIKTCSNTCERIGNAWIQRLRNAGQHEVSGWVQDQLKQENYWKSDVPADEPVDPGNSITNGKMGSLSSRSFDRVRNIPQEAELPEEKVTSSDETSNADRKGVLPLMRLRRIGERHGDEPVSHSSSITRLITEIDRLGAREETMWPYEWSMIQDAAKENTKRMYTETLLGRPRKARKIPEIEVIPATLLSAEQIASRDSDELHATQALLSGSHVMNAFERKRKAALLTGDSTTQTDTNGQKQSEELISVARLPMEHGSQERWLWKDVVGSLSLSQRDHLVRSMVHPEVMSGPMTPSNAILGSIKDVGEYQFLLQPAGSGRDNTQWTDKERRRYRRAATKERMGSRRLLKEDRSEAGSGGSSTKVERTVDPENKCYLEIDLGNALLESRDGDGRSRWYAFSSIEMTLLDEDVETCGNLAITDIEKKGVSHV